MKYIKLFEEFDPYAYLIMSPNEKAELIIDEVMKEINPRLDFIKNLIELGANLEYFDNKRGETVLHLACEFTDNIELINLLLDYGVNPNIRDENEFTPLFNAVSNIKSGATIAKILIDRGADFKTTNKFSGCTALHIASEYANYKAVQVLLEYGANPNSLDNEMNTPLHYVLERESVEVTELLLEYGANPLLKNVDSKSPYDLSKDLWTKDIYNLFKNHRFIKDKEKENLNELRFNYIYKRTPKRYKERAKGISVKFLTKTKKNKYVYQTITKSSGNKHRQWVKPLSDKIITLENLDQHVIAHCDCNDFRYENEWLLWTKDASEIISSNGQPLQKMNPKRMPKFCKHLSAIKEDLYNRLKKD